MSCSSASSCSATSSSSSADAVVEDVAAEGEGVGRATAKPATAAITLSSTTSTSTPGGCGSSTCTPTFFHVLRAQKWQSEGDLVNALSSSQGVVLVFEDLGLQVHFKAGSHEISRRSFDDEYQAQLLYDHDAAGAAQPASSAGAIGGARSGSPIEVEEVIHFAPHRAHRQEPAGATSSGPAAASSPSGGLRFHPAERSDRSARSHAAQRLLKNSRTTSAEPVVVDHEAKFLQKRLELQRSKTMKRSCMNGPDGLASSSPSAALSAAPQRALTFEDHAAEKLTKVIRGKLVRDSVERMKREMHLAAAKIAALWKGNHDRIDFLKRKIDEETRLAASEIESEFADRDHLFRNSTTSSPGAPPKHQGHHLHLHHVPGGGPPQLLGHHQHLHAAHRASLLGSFFLGPGTTTSAMKMGSSSSSCSGTPTPRNYSGSTPRHYDTVSVASGCTLDSIESEELEIGIVVNERMKKAVEKITAVMRGHLDRSQTAQMRAEVVGAANVIKAYFRGARERAELRRVREAMHEAALKIQQAYKQSRLGEMVLDVCVEEDEELLLEDGDRDDEVGEDFHAEVALADGLGVNAGGSGRSPPGDNGIGNSSANLGEAPSRLLQLHQRQSPTNKKISGRIDLEINRACDKISRQLSRLQSQTLAASNSDEDADTSDESSAAWRHEEMKTSSSTSDAAAAREAEVEKATAAKMEIIQDETTVAALKIAAFIRERYAYAGVGGKLQGGQELRATVKEEFGAAVKRLEDDFRGGGPGRVQLRGALQLANSKGKRS